MSTMLPGAAESPLVPVYPFNEPGEPVLLYDGPIGGLAATDVSGIVELSCVPRPSLDWSIRPNASPAYANRSEVTLLLRRSDGDMRMPGLVRGNEGGWSNGAVFGIDAPLERIIAHWFNLPNWHGPIELTAMTEDGGKRWWSGRWVLQVDTWTITLDVRPDHMRVWSDLHKSHVYVMTHVMEFRRTDGATFTGTEAEPVLTALHVGVSFALGRWAAPMLPVGEDAKGKIVWENWRCYHCDPAQRTSPGWWYEQDHATLADFLDLTVRAFSDPDRRAPLRLQMLLAIVATNAQGFVEPRIMNGVAGLEHFMWHTLVLGGRMTKKQYEGKSPYQGRWLHAHDHLRTVLEDARIPTDIDATLLPVMARFVAEERRRQGKTLDGADAVTQIRNRLVHPKGGQEDVYRLDGLITEAWLLTRHYLVLLILHSLGYRGLYRDLRRTHGWAGDVASVPWL